MFETSEVQPVVQTSHLTERNALSLSDLEEVWRIADEMVRQSVQSMKDSSCLSRPVPFRRQPPPPTGDQRTTLMVKNVPNKLTRDQLVTQLERRLPAGGFDFVYMPIDFKTRCNYGYLFVNVSEPCLVRVFLDNFGSFRFPEPRSTKICEIVFARVQGLQANVNRLINSPILTSCATGEDDAALPLVFWGGKKITFRQLLNEAVLRDNNMFNWVPGATHSDKQSAIPSYIPPDPEAEKLFRDMITLLDSGFLLSNDKDISGAASVTSTAAQSVLSEL